MVIGTGLSNIDDIVNTLRFVEPRGNAQPWVIPGMFGFPDLVPIQSGNWSETVLASGDSVDSISMVGVDEICVIRLDRIAHNLADQIQVVPMNFLGQNNLDVGRAAIGGKRIV